MFSPIDVLLVINYINANAPELVLPPLRPIGADFLTLEGIGALRMYGPDGKIFRTFAEQSADIAAAESRAAEAESRAAALEAKLRELGVEP